MSAGREKLERELLPRDGLGLLSGRGQFRARNEDAGDMHRRCWDWDEYWAPMNRSKSSRLTPVFS